MSVFQDDSFISCDGKTEIHVRRCLPEGTPRGVVQLAHGIAEHIGRYDGFAQFLAEQGFVVVGNDHLGHGLSVRDPEDLGFLAETGGWNLVVGDMRRLYEETHDDFPDLPYFLLGHSMGSFLARSYIIRHRDGLRGCILSGTAQQPAAVVAAGRTLGNREIRRHGARYRSEFLNGMAFGSYLKRIKNPRTPSDWLSRDNAVVDRFVADPLCGFIPTAELFTDMMGGIAYNQRHDNLLRMNRALPVYFFAGDRDPVGAYGKGVVAAYRSFLGAGMRNVTMKLYSGGRHEMLNELNRDEVYADVLNWLQAVMAGPNT